MKLVSIAVILFISLHSIAQNIGIGTLTPAAKLDIRHNSSTISPTLNLYDINPTNYSRLQFQNASGSKFWHIAGHLNNSADALSRLNFHHSVFGDVMTLTGDGKVGLGTFDPLAKQHIRFNGSEATPQLLLEETELDYSRIVMRSHQSFYWTIRGFTSSTTSNDRFNIYHNVTGDILSITGDGRVGIGTVSPTAKLEVSGNVKSNAFQFSTPKTSYLSVGFQGFHPSQSEDYTTMFLNGITLGNASHGGGGSLIANVQLPHGATITGFKAYVTDSSTTHNIAVALNSYNLETNTVETIAFAASSGSNGDYTLTNSSITNPIVNNQTKTYEISANGSTTGTFDWPYLKLILKGVVVTYTVNEAQ